jgi:hypothetical protein
MMFGIVIKTPEVVVSTVGLVSSGSSEEEVSGCSEVEVTTPGVVVS